MAMTKQTPVTMSSSPAQPDRPIGPRIWQACAGSTVWIPTVNSSVLYFPQGHLEQCNSAPSIERRIPPLSVEILSQRSIKCRIYAISFHADASDEVFARMSLLPFPLDKFYPKKGSLDGGSEEEKITTNDKVLTVSDVTRNKRPRESESGILGEGEITTHAKVLLAASDVDNGNEFTVRWFGADLHDDPSEQELEVSDLQGVSWRFNHIKRGGSHALSGWTDFVKTKKLVAGDTVLFMKNLNGMFVGLRRAPRTSDAANVNGIGRVTLDSIMDAERRANKHKPFEVIYYPRGGSEFVVRAELVEAADKIPWGPGIQVKMAVEADDSLDVTWVKGTVSSYSVQEKTWQGSAWRSLKIKWEGDKWNGCTFSPWQVSAERQVEDKKERTSPIDPAPPRSLEADTDAIKESIGEGNYDGVLTYVKTAEPSFRKLKILESVTEFALKKLRDGQA